MENNILTIPNGTVKIETCAYKGQNYTHVEFPSSLIEIGESAFEGCENLTYLMFPPNLKIIGRRAFYACVSLGEVFIPESVTEIGEEAFSKFGLIYCETLNPYSKGWFYEREHYMLNAGGQVGNMEEEIYCDDYHTWCGSYQCKVTSEGYYVNNQNILLNPMRKCLFGRKRMYIHILKGIFYYNLPQHLLDLGEDTLQKGMGPNMNITMKTLQETLVELVENGQFIKDGWQFWLALYTEAAVDPLTDLNHNEEAAFILWGIMQYMWQLLELSDRPDIYKKTEKIIVEKRAYMHNMLVSFTDKWETILGLLEQVDLTKAKLAAWIKAYYQRGERWREERIISAYHELYFGKNRKYVEEEKGEAYYQQAVKLIGEQEYDKAGKLFGKAAKYGHAAGQFNYGISLMNGEGCASNPLEACYWYWAAAHQGHSKAMMNLAICYRNGQGVLQNGIKMLEWYAKAAYYLQPEAVYNLGLSLKHEEVIRGLSALGVTLINASDDVSDYMATQDFVKRTTKIILEELEKLQTENEKN